MIDAHALAMLLARHDGIDHGFKAWSRSLELTVLFSLAVRALILIVICFLAAGLLTVIFGIPLSALYLRLRDNSEEKD